MVKLTRDEILVAAAGIIGEKGFDATSMQDIANAVNLQKASLYHHFSSKQEILLALLDHALYLLTDRLEDVRSSSISPKEKLRQAMVAYLQVIASQQNLASVLLLEYRALEPDLREQHVLRRDRFEHLWRDLIDEGMDAGMFYCEDSSLAGRAILGVLNWAVTWYRRDGPSSAEEIADQFADLFLDGLLVRPGSRSL
jgi:TetR/AcrR family transcriptional regulator, cholesterol catabolism regulator